METSLHRALKQLYAGDDGEVEARRGRYRIDAVRGDELIEIQHSGLAAIRDKVRTLLSKHRVRVVKPIVALKRIIKCETEDGPELSSRQSPKRGVAHDLFDELVYFASIFPNPRLSIETPLVEIEEVRTPGHGRRRRRRQNDFVIVDQRLVRVLSTREYRTPRDLLSIVPKSLRSPFDTAAIAKALAIGTRSAQRVAYCLRAAGAIRAIGHRQRRVVYERA